MSSKISKNFPVIKAIGAGTAIGLGTVYGLATGTDPISASLILGAGIGVLGNLGVELAGGAIDYFTPHETCREEILKNGDLTRAVGKAIFLGFLEEADKTSNENDKEIFIQIGNSNPIVWEEIILGLEVDSPRITIDKSDLSELIAGNLTRYFRAKEGEIDNLTALDNAEEWRNIVEKICEQHRRLLSVEGAKEVSESLHQNFPRYLRKILSRDFEDNGAAYASMQLRLSGEILAYSRANYHELQVNTLKLDALIGRVNELQWLNDSKSVFLDNKFWNEAFDLSKSTLQIVTDLLSRVEAVKKDTEEILEILKGSQSFHKSTQKFIPKNFPSRLTYFTGREKVLADIKEALETRGTAAFADTHGVGKSSVALEFAYRHQENYEQILFIRATANEFNIYVSEILNDLGIVLSNDATPQQRLSALQEWLAKNEKWLLLVDNVDDVEFIHSCGFNKSNGKVIYTSNDDRIYSVGRKIILPKMIDENAMLLLYKHWKSEPDAKFADIPAKYHSTLKGIAEKFGHHPFSMAFVGSYLAEEQESLDDFLSAYNSREENLLERYKFLSNYHYPNVAKAFLLRFEQISMPKDDSERENFLSVAVNDYLKLSAFVGTDNIPEELLQQSLEKLHPDQSEWTSDEKFIKDIYKRFKPTSIFKRDGESKTLTTHRIVQEIMNFQINDEKDLLLAALADVLDANFESFNFTNQEKVERYLAHVGIFLEYLETTPAESNKYLLIENKSTASLCYSYARYFEIYGQYTKAEKYYQYYKEICERNKEIDQSMLAASYNNLAKFYKSQGRDEECESYYLKAIENSEKELGENHPTTTNAYNNLGGFYAERKKYKEAEEYYLKSLRIEEKELGENHISMAKTYNNLGVLYDDQEKYKEAEEYYLKAIRIKEKELGENHLEVTISYSNLGKLYKSQGKYEEAEKYFLKAIRIKEKEYGENHILTTYEYDDLGSFYESQEKYEEAEEYYLKSLKIVERELGENHPDTVRIYDNLGGFYFGEGRDEEAEEYYLKSLQIRKKILRENHPDITISYDNLGYFYESQGNYEEAEKYYLKSLEICLKDVGENHLNTSLGFHALAKFYSKTQRFAMAREYQQKALHINLKLYGENDSDVANAYWWLGYFWEKGTNFKEALEYYRKSKEIYLKSLSKDHPSVTKLQKSINDCEKLINEK